MIRLIKRRLAIRGYVWKLSKELSRRFGIKGYYNIDEVTQAAQRGGLATAFLAYAHAIYCNRAEFERHYGPLQVACSYDGLRAVVQRRYFKGSGEMDASSIIRATRGSSDNDFYESGIGEDLH